MPSVVEQPIPGGWTDREVTVGGHRFRLHTPTDPDELLNFLEAPEAAGQPHLADPYWAKLWPAAPLLAEAIVRACQATTICGSLREPQPPTLASGGRQPSELFRGKRCLELGCGSGLVGMAALASGFDVTFSDYIPLAVELALENAARNGLPPARGLVLDWKQPPQDQKFPFIVAADVTYDRTNIAPLLNVLDHMLAREGQAWFGDAGRGPAAEFCQRALDRNWQVSLFDEHDGAMFEPTLGRYQRIVLRWPPR